MKKLLVVFTIIALTLCAAACGSEAGTGDVDISKIHDTVVEFAEKTEGIHADSLLQETDETYIEQLYSGISDIEIEESEFWIWAIAGYGFEVSAVKLADPKDAAAVEEIFNARIEAAAGDTFYPENSGMWKNNSNVYTYGNYVILVCLPEECGLPDAELDALFA